jgi:hypothetical protein
VINKGRRIAIPEASEGVARVSFDGLCAQPLGAGDYREIAQRFGTILLAGIPVLGPGNRNEAKRLINLVDTFYDNGNRLIVSAAAEPDELWRGTDATEGFEFARTASRLVEMRSDAYWNAHSAAPPERRAQGPVSASNPGCSGLRAARKPSDGAQCSTAGLPTPHVCLPSVLNPVTRLTKARRQPIWLAPRRRDPVPSAGV